MVKLIGGVGPVDMLGWDLEGMADSVPLEETSTRAVFYDAFDDETFVFTGKKFTYDHGAPTGGIITGFQFQIGDSVNFSMSGLKLKVTDILHYVETQDVAGLMDKVMGGDDVIKGSKLGDSLYGLGGADSISGGNGADVIIGGDGDDTLAGGTGSDALTGGAGSDTFMFAALNESSKKAADLIFDLDAGDTIDLSAIDANTSKSGDQAFKLVGAFSHHAGEAVLSYSNKTGLTSLSLDVNGDAKADAVITISGDHADFTHFVL